MKRVEAIRNDVLVGRGTCSAIDECWSDDEVLEMLDEFGKTTVEAAIKWARDNQEMWLEQGLNQREGNDDDPQLLAWQAFRAARERAEK